MRNQFFTKSIITYSIFFLALVHISMADFGSRMKERLPEIVAAKDKGLIGEGTDGFIHVRDGESEKIKKLAIGENSDRKLLFKSMAKKTGGSTKEVASKFSKAVVKKSKKGHWFRKSSGKWIQRN